MLGPLSVLTATRGHIYLYSKNVDMRKSFDGLQAIVQSEYHADVRHGDLFVFLNRRLDRIKLLWWDMDGLAYLYKRLEAGTFQRPLRSTESSQLEIDATELGLLLTGIELSSVRRRRRYSTPAIAAPSTPGASPS